MEMLLILIELIQITNATIVDRLNENLTMTEIEPAITIVFFLPFAKQ